MEIYIWGCGQYGQHALEYFDSRFDKKIEGFIDSKRTGMFLGKNIFQLNELIKPFVIVADKDNKAIENELLASGYKPIEDYILLDTPVNLIAANNYADVCGNVVSGKFENVSVTMSAASRIEIGDNVTFGKNVSIVSRGFSKIVISAGSVIGDNVTIVCEEFSEIQLGEDYVCKDNSSIVAKYNSSILLENGGAIGENAEIIVADSRLSIGKGTDFDKNLILRTQEGTRVEIGDDCMFSYNVSIRGSQGHPILEKGMPKVVKRDVHIANHVWIGMNVQILPGTGIGNNCVVAAASVLNRDYEEGTLIAGNIGKVIKNDIGWSR